ncbi:hypothetical protein GH714_039908 [Hevea brasiliensis]|uniref:IBB domain-containing protein n=1 Tax=Hevea brasiliensis TaxID=3981 RepID=A0A6A6M3M0_HEVBR|nr:hypothetical protein GH714_039908 [Hevea brasiliensis]
MSLRPSTRTEVRQNRYKVAVDADEGRRRREDNMVEIRKSKREESLQKKRREALQAQQFPPTVLSSTTEKKLESLPSMVAGVWSDDGSLQLEATTQFRKLLSIERNPPIEEVIQSGVVPRFVEFLVREDFPQLHHPSPSVLVPALRTVGNIVTGDDIQTQAVIEAGLIGPLVNLVQNAEFDIKKEAAWAISNATSGGTHDQIKYLVSQGCIKPLCDLLVCPDPRIVTVCLEGLENILKVGEAEKNLGNSGDYNMYAQMIDDAEGLEKIENLQSHDNNEIYEKAVKILETYWLEEDDETLPSGDGSQQGFQFGGNDPSVPSGGFNFS